MDFLVGLAIGVALGVVVGIAGYPASIMWLARREHAAASLGVDEGPFARIDIPAPDRIRAPGHAN